MEWVAAAGRSALQQLARLSADYFPEILVVAVLGLLVWAIKKTFQRAPHSPF